MTAQGLVDWCKSRLGQGYIYGEYFSRIITAERIQQKARQYPSLYTDSYIQRSRKWIGQWAADCVGLIKAYYWWDGKQVVYRYKLRVDTSANGMLQRSPRKGAISTMPDVPGLFVHYSGHIGVYIGAGEVIEARGVDYGVVKTKLKDRPWTSWGEVPYVDYGGKTMRRMLKVESPFMRGDDVKEFQAAANIVNNAGLTEDGIYGPASGNAAKALQSKFGLTADGIVGPKTWSAIDEALEPSTGSEFEELYNQAQAALEKAQAEISSLTAKVKAAENAKLVAENKLAQVRQAVNTIKNA